MSGSIKRYLFNLIIYTHEKHRAEYFHQMVRSFIEEYPCQVIFIHGIDNSDSHELTTESVKGTCSQLNITVPKKRVSEVPLLILPHLIPDLPVYLVWGQNPISENQLLPQLQKLATRFIYDADCTPDLQKFSKKILAYIESVNTEFMDVCWAQISGWRDVIAEAFDSKEKLRLLKNAKSITIKYNALPNNPIKQPIIPPIYLQAWLAAQLGWKPISFTNGDSATVVYDNMGNDLLITLIAQERPSIRQGRLFEITFELADSLTYTLSLQDIQSKVLVYISTNNECCLPLSIGIQDTQKGLTAMKEIFYYQSSDHYRHMVKILSEITWKE